MNWKDFNLYFYGKLIAIAAIIVLFLTKTPIWEIIQKGLKPVVYAFIIAYILDYTVRYFEEIHKYIYI